MSGGKFSRQYAVVAETRRCWSDAEKEAVVAEAEQPGVPANSEPDAGGGRSPSFAGAARHRAVDRIEIELGNGRLVRIGADVDVAALRRILDALERR